MPSDERVDRLIIKLLTYARKQKIKPGSELHDLVQLAMSLKEERLIDIGLVPTPETEQRRYVLIERE
jgi:hypothetical protein